MLFQKPSTIYTLYVVYVYVHTVVDNFVDTPQHGNNDTWQNKYVGNTILEQSIENGKSITRSSKYVYEYISKVYYTDESSKFRFSAAKIFQKQKAQSAHVRARLSFHLLYTILLDTKPKVIRLANTLVGSAVLAAAIFRVGFDVGCWYVRRDIVPNNVRYTTYIII